MDEDIELRLRWRHTWEDKDKDFVAEAPGYDGTVARIYQHLKPGSLDHDWFWAMNAHGYEISRAGKTSGYEDSPRRAARAAEDAWFEAIKGSSLDVAADPVPTRNAYAAAKGRE
jgi:hypothetical protein